MVARNFSLQDLPYNHLLQVPEEEREFLTLEELKPHQLTELGVSIVSSPASNTLVTSNSISGGGVSVGPAMVASDITTSSTSAAILGAGSLLQNYHQQQQQQHNQHQQQQHHNGYYDIVTARSPAK